MIEQDLEDFEDFYKQRVNAQFFKIKKVTRKLIQEVRENLIEIKVCLDHFLETGKEKIDQKAQRSLNFFSDRIRKEIEEIEIPEGIEASIDGSELTVKGPEGENKRKFKTMGLVFEIKDNKIILTFMSLVIFQQFH